MAASDVSIRFKGDARDGVAASRQMSRALDETGDHAEKAEHHFRGLAGAVASKAFIGATLAVGALGTAVGVTGFKFDAMREQAQIAFTTMLGSAQKANKFLDQLQAFAAKTPFEFPELVQTSQRLLAMGFSAQKVIPMMTAIGDAVAAMGGTPEMLDRVTLALGQMQAKGKVSAEEMLQLTEAGIPAWDMLAKKIGVSIPQAMKLAQKGTIDSGTAINAITQGMEQRFGGMMEKQSHTFQGLLSTVKDTFGQIAGKVMGPFFEWAVKGLQKLVDLFDTKGWQKAIDGITSFVKTAGGWIGHWVKVVGGYAVDAGRFLVDGFKKILPTLKRVIGGIAGFVKDAFGTIRTIVGRAFDVLGPLASRAAGAIEKAFDIVWPKISAGFKAIEHSAEEAFDAVVGAAQNAAGQLSGMGPELRKLWAGVSAVAAAELKKIVDDFIVIKEQMILTWATVAKQLSLLIDAIGPQAIAILTKIGVAWVDATSELASVLITAVGTIVRTLLPALRIMLTLLANLLGPMDKVATALGGWKNVIEAVMIAMALWKTRAIAQAVAVTAANIIQAATTAAAWEGAFAAVTAAGRAALIASGWGALAVAAGLAAVFVINHWKQVQAFFKNFGENMTAIWKATKAALVASLRNLPTSFKGAFELAAAYALAGLAVLAAGAAKALGWIPGVGGKVKAASRAIDGFVKHLAVQGAKDFAAAGLAGADAFGKNLNLNLGTQLGTATDQVQTAATQWASIVSGVSLTPSVAAAGGVDQSQMPVGPVQGSGAAGAVTSFARFAGPNGRGARTYVFGASSIKSGYDCSGLVVAAYKQAGIDLPHNAALQFFDPNGVNVTGQEQPGDAVYKNTAHPTGGHGNPGHVGIYMGNDQIIEYSIPGEGPRYGSLSAWKKAGVYAGARRWYKVKPGAGGGDVTASHPTPPKATPPDTGGGDAGAGATTVDTTTVKKPHKITVATKRAIDAAIDAKAAIEKTLKDVVDPRLAKHIETELDKIGVAFHKGVKADDLARAKAKLSGVRKEITNALKFDDIVRAAGRARETVANMNPVLLTPRQRQLWDKAVDDYKALKKRVLKDGVISDRELDQLTAAQKKLSDKASAYTKAIAANAKAAAEAAKDLAKWWAQEQDSVISAAGISINLVGKSVADSLKKAGVIIAGSVTGGDYIQAWNTFKAAQVKLAKGGLTAPVIDQLKLEAQQAQDVIAAWGDQLVASVNQQRSTFEKAWGKFVNLALQAFDKTHEAMRAALQVALTFDGVTIKLKAGDLTPSESELKKVTDAIAKIDEAATVQQLKDAVYSAASESDWNRARLALQEHYLQQKADVEREAADAALEEQQKMFDERTAAERDQFQEELDDIQGHMEDGTLKYRDGLDAVRALFAKYKIPFEQQSSILGESLSSALTTAFGAVGVAMQNLATAIAALLAFIEEKAGRSVQLAQVVSDQVSNIQLVYGIPGMPIGSGQAPAYQVGGAGGEVTYFPGKAYATGGVVGGMSNTGYVPSDSYVSRLSQNEMVLTPSEQSRLLSLAEGKGGGGGGWITVNVYPQGSVIVERDLTETIRAALAPTLRANGRSPI